MTGSTRMDAAGKGAGDASGGARGDTTQQATPPIGNQGRPRIVLGSTVDLGGV